MTLIVTSSSATDTIAGSAETRHAEGPSTPYRYHALSGSSCIIVVKAALQTEQGEISCRIRELDIDSWSAAAAPYHCLSYTWGNPYKDNFETDWTQTFRIHVVGPGDSSGYLLVTKNLHDFLQELARRNPPDVEHVWIDAICINQEDLQERAAQVSIMSHIYRNCEAVIVWFGIEDPDAAAAFSIMAHLDFSFRDWLDIFRRHRSGTSASVDLSLLYATLGIPTPSPENFISCGRFLRRAWLYRIWTLQESMLPHTGFLWCGSLQTPLLCLSHLISIMSQTLHSQFHPILSNLPGRGVPTDFTVALAATIDRISISRERMLLARQWTTVDPYRGADCFDPRYKVYGPLRCIHTLEDPSVRVTRGLPSWVPGYYVESTPPSWRDRGGSGAGYCAGNATERKIEKLPSDNTLILALSGFEEDVVDAVGASYDEIVHSGGILLSLELLLQRLVPASDEDQIETFWRVLIANLPGNSNRPPKSDEFGPSFRALVLFLLASHISKDEEQTEMAKSLAEKLNKATGSPHLPDWAEVLQLAVVLGSDKGAPAADAVVSKMMTYLKSLTRMSLMRRFFVTRKNRLGLGSQTVREGDRVFILSGFNYPVLLRPAASGRYIVLGDTYVQGMMFGEALEGQEFVRVEIE
ncbi:heterokaryon incompatibility protein-domain-containing protein [Plectosphaerella plurivora]|uniref:Heterokaryon incompatibility protein-domain-containing protein n=1 Tax=Plectosphaerella plurivora TaxID=936078 RepID=A0A9P8V8A8_9PEZI|nr:heterokaryon incompatibility protein-domain-containing protein [Plectosphaerella plurivora]